MSAFVSWPLRFSSFSFVHAGVYPMQTPDCNRPYRHRTLALHLHDYAGTIWIGKRSFALHPGDITFSPGGRIASRYELPESGQHLCIHIEPPEATVPSRAVRLPLHLRLGAATAEARERFWRVIDYVRRSGGRHHSAAAAAAEAAMQEFVLWLHLKSEGAARPARGSALDAAVERLEQAIEASLTKSMSLGELAANVGLSADYVARAFARRYGMRLQHYLLLRRIELARHLLVSSDRSVADVGRSVGLPDPQYFNKQFRRVAGISPLAYRRQLAQRRG